jgi:MFS family permease
MTFIPIRGSALATALAGTVALAAAMGIGRFVYTPILPLMAEGLDLSKSTAGLIASANFLGYLAGALLAAVPQLSGGRKAWVLAALFAVAATTAAMACGDTTTTFLVLRFCGGAASALVLVLGSALVLERLVALKQRELAALHFAGVGLGIAVSAATLALLQANGAGWRSLWLVEGALAMLAVPAFAFLVGGEGPAAPQHANIAFASAADRPAPGLGWLDLGYGLFGFGYVVTATFLVAAMHTAPWAPYAGLMAWAVVGLTAIPSTALWSWLGRRHGPLQAYSAASIVAALGVASGGLWPGLAGALLAAVLFGGTFMGLTALGFEAARLLAPWRQRRSFAIMTASFGVGQMAGPLLAGWLMDRTQGFVIPSLVGAAALLLSGLCVLKAGWTSRGQDLGQAQQGGQV